MADLDEMMIEAQRRAFHRVGTLVPDAALARLRTEHAEMEAMLERIDFMVNDRENEEYPKTVRAAVRIVTANFRTMKAKRQQEG